MNRKVIHFAALLIAAVGTSVAEPAAEEFLSPPADPGPTTVKVWFNLHDINEINDKDETFGFNGVLRLTWKDPRQAYDVAVAGVREKIYQGSFQVDEIAPAWSPQVYLVNESGVYETNAVTLRVSPDGTSVLTSSIHAVAETNLSMREFPFDAQILKAEFMIPGFRSDEVVFAAEGAEHDQDLKVSQWELVGVTVSTGAERSPGFILNVSVKRDPIFTLRLVGLPLVLIVLLSWSVFWMDRSSLGDRISVSFVGILTAVAYQIVVGDLLPHVSYITVMHGFLNFSFLIMCATVVINLVVGACDKNGKHALGELIDRRCRWIFPLAYLGLLSVVAVIAIAFF
jgi:hypothetical protein